jgi:hypothetical protein
MKDPVHIAPAPAGEPLSEAYEVCVNGRSVPVYTARAAEVRGGPDWTLPTGCFGGGYAFASFDVSGRVEVAIRSRSRPLDRAIIRPPSRVVASRFEDGVLIFELDGPRQLSIEPSGRTEPLLLFADPAEESPPSPEDPDTLYFGPGRHDAGTIEVGSGRTVYLAGGAVVRGRLVIRGEEITVRGRGILCGGGWDWGGGLQRLVDVTDSRRVRIEGIVIRGAPCWTIAVEHSEDVTVDHVKICGGRNPNDDGINPCNARNVRIRDCFIRTDDDCIAIKGLRRRPDGRDAVDHIVIENSILWADRARAILMGHESQAAHMRHIRLRGLDVIHCSMTPLLLEPGEDMSMEDVTVESVRVHAEGWRPAFGLPDDLDPHSRKWDFIALHPSVNFWMRKKAPGRIRRAHFRDIELTGEDDGRGYAIWLGGADARHAVEEATFENVTLFGAPAAPDHPLVHVGEHCQTIRFAPSAADLSEPGFQLQKIRPLQAES